MKRKKMSAGKSRFRGRIKENAKSRRRGSAYGYLVIPQGVEVFNPEPDTTVKMDIMPYEVTYKKHPDSPMAEVGELWYKRPFKIHRDVGVGNDKVVCPTSLGKKCPICEYRAKLLREDGDKKEADALKPSARNLYAVILKGKKGGDKVHLFDFSDHNFQKVFEEQLADLYPDEFEVFPDHQEGYTVAVVFAEDSFMGYKFAKPTRFDFLERKEQYEDGILDSVPKLDKCLAVLSYEELRAKFFEIEEDEEEEEDEQPVRKTRKSKVEEPEEEEEDEDDYEDEEDDYEDEEDDYEEEEEEPKPALKRKRKVASTTRQRR